MSLFLANKLCQSYGDYGVMFWERWRNIYELRGEFKGSLLIWNNVYSQASPVTFLWLHWWCRTFMCFFMCVCVCVWITSDNFLTDEYWVLTFLWIRVSVQWAQQENSKVGQCLQSSSLLLDSFWRREFAELQMQGMNNSYQSHHYLLDTFLLLLLLQPLDVFFLHHHTYRKMCLKRSVGMCCALCPSGSRKMEVTGGKQTPLCHPHAMEVGSKWQQISPQLVRCFRKIKVVQGGLGPLTETLRCLRQSELKKVRIVCL